jgi:endoglycosylceramidase
MTAAVRSVDPRRPVFVEPFVLFNFGGADTALPGVGSTNVLSTHVYALNSEANASVMDRSVAAAQRDAVAVAVTEWGDSNDPATLDTFEDQFDQRLLPWMYWSYNGHIVGDSAQPLVAPNLNEPVLTALSRPYPQVVDGTPTLVRFDSATATFDLSFSTTHPNGTRASRALQSSIVVPKLRYPNGYAVAAAGADVTSRPCAPVLTVRSRPGVSAVSLRVTPSNCP